MTDREFMELLEKERDKHLEMAESLNKTINTMKEKFFTNKPIKDKNYNSSWQISEKIAYFLKKEQRFLHNREISEMAHEQEPDIDMTDFITKFSSVLSRLKKEGQITSIQVGNSLRNTFWGNPGWLDEDGKVKEGHEIKEEYVFDKDKNKTSIFD